MQIYTEQSRTHIHRTIWPRAASDVFIFGSLSCSSGDSETNNLLEMMSRSSTVVNRRQQHMTNANTSIMPVKVRRTPNMQHMSSFSTSMYNMRTSPISPNPNEPPSPVPLSPQQSPHFMNQGTANSPNRFSYPISASDSGLKSSFHHSMINLNVSETTQNSRQTRITRYPSLLDPSEEESTISAYDGISLIEPMSPIPNSTSYHDLSKPTLWKRGGPN